MCQSWHWTVGFGELAVAISQRAELMPCKTPHKGSLALPPHTRGVARHSTGAKVALQQQIRAGSSLVSRRLPGVAITGVFGTD